MELSCCFFFCTICVERIEETIQSRRDDKDAGCRIICGYNVCVYVFVIGFFLFSSLGLLAGLVFIDARWVFFFRVGLVCMCYHRLSFAAHCTFIGGRGGLGWCVVGVGVVYTVCMYLSFVYVRCAVELCCVVHDNVIIYVG